MVSVNKKGIYLYFIINILFIISLYFYSPVGYYNEMIQSNFGMDVGVLFLYQILIYMLYLVGYKQINNYIMLSSPFISYLIYYFELGNKITKKIHYFIDGEWNGISTQAVPFDKGGIFIGLYFILMVILLSYYYNPKEKSFDRSAFLFFSTSLLMITVLYHIIAIITVYQPYSNVLKQEHTNIVKQIQKKSYKIKKPPIEGKNIYFKIFNKRELFPEETFDLFKGNNQFKVSKDYYNENLYKSFKRSEYEHDLFDSLVDDLNTPIYVGIGIFFNKNEKSIIYYNTMITPYAIIMGNSISIIISTYAFIWIYVWLFLSYLHHKRKIQ